MTVNERIKILRKNLGLTLEKFGERLGVKKGAISKLELGENNVSEQMFKSICREFNVNEEWLRDGTGDMFIDSENQLMIWAANVLKNNNDSFKRRVVNMLMGLTEDEWSLLEKKARELFEDSSNS